MRSHLTPHVSIANPRNIRFEPSAGSTAEVALQAYHGPAVLPGDRCQGDGTSNGVEVHHQQCPPLSALIFDNAALMNVGTCRGVLVNFRNTKLGTVLPYPMLDPLRHLCQRSSMVAKGFVGSDGDGLVGSPDALAA